MGNRIINILFCMNMIKNKEMFCKSFEKTLSEYQQQRVPDGETIKLGNVEMVNSKTDANMAIVSGNYDIVICRDKLENNEAIGIKCIEAWQEMQPDLRVILSVADSKKGGNSMLKLYRRGYFDAIYQNDMSDIGLLLYLIGGSRSDEAAFVYYGIRDNMEYQRELAEKRGADMMDMAPEMMPEMNDSIRKNQDGKETEPSEELWKTAMRTELQAENGPSEEDERKAAGGSDDIVVHKKQPNSFYAKNVDQGTLKESLMGDIENFFVSKNSNEENTINTERMTQDFSAEEGEMVPQLEEERTRDRQEQREKTPDQYVRQRSENKNVPEQSRGSDNDKVKNSKREMSGKEKSNNEALLSKKESKTMEKVEGETQFVVKKINQASVMPHEGYIVTVLSDQAIIVEVPGAHFLQAKEYLPSMPVNLITPQIQV